MFKPLSTNMKTYTVSFSRVSETITIDTERTIEQVCAAGWLEEFHEGWPDIAIAVVGISSFGSLTDEEVEFDMAVMLRPEDYELVKEDFEFAENVPPEPIKIELRGREINFRRLIRSISTMPFFSMDPDHPLTKLLTELEDQLDPQADRTLDFIDLAEIFKE